MLCVIKKPKHDSDIVYEVAYENLFDKLEKCHKSSGPESRNRMHSQDK